MNTNLFLIGFLLSVVSNMASAQTYTFKSDVRAFGPLGAVLNPPDFLVSQPAVIEGEFKKEGDLISHLVFSMNLKNVIEKDCNGQDYTWREYSWIPTFMSSYPLGSAYILNDNDSRHRKVYVEISAQARSPREEDIRDTALMGLAKRQDSIKFKILFICPRLPLDSESVQCTLAAESSLESRPLFGEQRNVYLQSLNEESSRATSRPGFFLPLVHIKLKQ